MIRSSHSARRGFALVITLGLLALLVLAVYALSALVRVNSQLAASGIHQTQARENALLALSLALGKLQRYAGPDGSVTAPAGVLTTTLPENQRWTGVWVDQASTPQWLVSGSSAPSAYRASFSFDTSSPRKVVVAGSDDVALVAEGAINTAASGATAYPVGDAVIVPKMTIQSFAPAGTVGAIGRYAYWVGDEGAKVSYWVPDAESPGIKPRAVELATTTVQINAFPSDTAALQKTVAFDQLTLVPGKPAASFLKTNFHHSTLTNRSLKPVGIGVQVYAGPINLNTTSGSVWRVLLRTYNDANAGSQVASIATKSSSIAAAMPAATGRPFFSIQQFLDSGLMRGVLAASEPTQEQVVDYLRPILVVRSDTFRIRAYGEVTDATDATRVEAKAYCEAIVQRTADSTIGRRFVVTYFRWLGPGDI